MTRSEAKHQILLHGQPEICHATIAFLAMISVRENRVSIKEALLIAYDPLPY